MNSEPSVDAETVLERIGLIRNKIKDPRSPQTIDDLALPSIAALLQEARHYIDDIDPIYSSLLIPVTRDQASTFSLDLILAQVEAAIKYYVNRQPDTEGKNKKRNDSADGSRGGGMHESLESGSDDSSARQVPRYRTIAHRTKESCVVPGRRSTWESDLI
jgi:hypothetical protein